MTAPDWVILIGIILTTICGGGLLVCLWIVVRSKKKI